MNYRYLGMTGRPPSGSKRFTFGVRVRTATRCIGLPSRIHHPAKVGAFCLNMSYQDISSHIKSYKIYKLTMSELQLSESALQVTYNSLISACHRGSQWQRALIVLKELEPCSAKARNRCK